MKGLQTFPNKTVKNGQKMTISPFLKTLGKDTVKVTTLRKLEILKKEREPKTPKNYIRLIFRKRSIQETFFFKHRTEK